MTEIIITSSALILFLMAVRRLLRGRIHPSLQYALWLLVAARLLIPGTLFTAPISLLDAASPLLTTIEDTLLPTSQPPLSDTYIPIVPETIPPSTVTVDGDTIITTYPPQATVPTVARTVSPIKTLRLIGVLTVGGALLLSNITFYRKLQKGRRPIPPSELPYPCKISVYQVSDLVTPCLFGPMHPGIYLNTGTLSSEELEHILTHEETHYRHGDHLWAVLRCVCLALHWYNPLVWWAAVLSRRDCELSCDHGTIRRLGEENRIRYGETLLRMVVPGRHPIALLRTATTMSGGKKTMTERIRLIANQPKMLKITLALVVLSTCIAVVITFGGSAEEPAKPSNDQITADSPADDENATDTDTSTGTLDQITAHELYVRARDFWNWFEFGTFPTTGTTLQTEDGTMLQLDGFDTLESLRWQLEAYFSPPLTEHLLTNYTRFQESDGKLFVLPTNRGSNIYAGKESFKAFPLSGTEAAQHGYDCHIYSTTEVLDFYDTETVLYQKRHDWYMAWNGQNYVFTSFGPYDDVDPQRYYNVLTILDHYNRGTPITDWLPVLANLDWNALYASQDLWPEDFDLGMYILTSLSEYVASENSFTPVAMDHILSATEGLDGAYAEQYQFIVYELYQKNPAAFAYVVLETLSANHQARILDFLRYEEQYHRTPSADSTPMTREKAIALLRQNMSDLLSATPASMYFEQPGQQEQILSVNAYGIHAASYTSSNSTVATVDDLGFVTAVAPGETIITLHYEGAAGQKDLTCTVKCEWDVAANSQETTQMQDGEIILGLSRGYSPTVWSIGSPQGLEVTLSGDWTLEGIRNALFAAVEQHVAGTLLEDDLRDITISYGFRFPDQMEHGVTMAVPFFIDYVDADVHTLPSGAVHSPGARTDELTAIVHLEGSGTTAPTDEDFFAHQAEYQQLSACVVIPDLEVAHDLESYDIIGAIQSAIDANLAAAGLDDRFHIQSVSLGSYYNPVWVDPGTVQTINGTVGFTGSFQSTFEFSFTVTTTQ